MQGTARRHLPPNIAPKCQALLQFRPGRALPPASGGPFHPRGIVSGSDECPASMPSCWRFQKHGAARLYWSGGLALLVSPALIPSVFRLKLSKRLNQDTGTRASAAKHRANRGRKMNTFLTPPGSLTGYGHPKCYVRSDMNCSAKITKEHFISSALLRRLMLNRTVKVAGLSWQSPQTFDLVPFKGLASHVLCDRHNNALHSLDDAAEKLARSIRAIDQSPATVPPVTTASGSDFERWIVKLVMG